MNQNEKYFNDLMEVRKLMEKSSKFISLSGLSGILAGLYALTGLYLVRNFLTEYSVGDLGEFISATYRLERIYSTAGFGEGVIDSIKEFSFIYIVAAAVVALSVVTGILLTAKKAKEKGQTMLDKIALKMVVNLSIPVVAGGFLMLFMIDNHQYGLLVPSMLIFYGLGLINGSKYTMNTIRNLGLVQVGLGIVAGLLPEYDIIIWAIGFGVMHIVYGTYMWWNFERKA